MLVEWILANRELLQIVYALVIGFVCSMIVLETDRMFKISDYQGLRYFRNSFFFYGLAFIVRFILGNSLFVNLSSNYFLGTNFFFEFFINLAGLFLLYSLIWKKMETEKKHHSLLNINAAVLYLVAFLIAMLDLMLGTNLYLYSSQVILFLIMGIISYRNYSKNKGPNNLSKLHFFTISVGLLVWIANFVVNYFLPQNNPLKIVAYFINLVFFLLFLYGTIKLIRKKNG